MTVANPCVIAMVPLMVGYVAGQEPRSVRRSFLLSATFAIGLTLMFGVLALTSFTASALILVGGTSMGFVQRLADSKGWNRGIAVLRVAAGVLIVLVGVVRALLSPTDLDSTPPAKGTSRPVEQPATRNPATGAGLRARRSGNRRRLGAFPVFEHDLDEFGNRINPHLRQGAGPMGVDRL